MAAESEAGLALTPGSFAALVSMEATGTLSATQAKAVLSALLAAGGGDPAAVAKRAGFRGPRHRHPGGRRGRGGGGPPRRSGPVYVDGDEKLQGFFVKAVMDATDRKANGKEVAAELRRRRG